MHSNEQQCDAAQTDIQFVLSILFSAPNPPLLSFSPSRLCFPQSPSLPPIKPSLETLQTRRGSGSLPLPHISFSPLSLSVYSLSLILPLSSSLSEQLFSSRYDHYYWIVAASLSLPLVCSLAHPLLCPSCESCLGQRGGRLRERRAAVR